MKNSILILMMAVFTAQNVTAARMNQEIESSDTMLLDFYRQYSEFTDPGAYKYLYAGLPDALPELCRLIKSQFIHPYAELPAIREQIPRQRWNEMFNFTNVQEILKGLLLHDSTGLVINRAPADRLILGCRTYALLLASILKYRGIPARLRYGHADYIIPDFHTSHTICEIWNEKQSRWMLVDPTFAMVDFSPDKFDFSHHLWLEFQNQEIDPNQYGIPGRYTGLVSILGKISPDLASILGTEYPIFHYAPVLGYALENNNTLTYEQTELLNKLCKLMQSLNPNNLKKLQKIYQNSPEIRISESFRQASTNPGNNTREIDP